MSDQSSAKPVVLLVDDESSSRFLARTALKKEGYDVREAEDGLVALTKLDEFTPDIILLDVLMPNLDGFEFCERLRSMPGKDRIPVLMMTGLDDIDSIRRAYQLGATDFITKPVNWLIFSHHVHYLLRASNAFKQLYESELKNKTLLEAIPDDMFWITENGSILEAREGKSSLLLPQGDDEAQRNVFQALPAQLAQELLQHMRQVLKTGEVHQFEYPTWSDGLMREWEFRLVRSGNQQVLVMLREVTERKRTERALKESEERYALASEAANDGLWDWDILHNEITFSSRWALMLGYEPDSISKNPEEWFSRIHNSDVTQVKALINNHLNGASEQLECEYRIRHKDGLYRWMLARGKCLRGADGKVYRMAGSQADIHSKKQAEEQLLHDAFYDTLTALPNRALFADRLTHAIKKSKRSLNPFAYSVIFLDLDRFKVVNDSLGHLTGDKLLIETARRLERCIRPGDTVARLGGDEFVVLLEDIVDLRNAEVVAKRIQKLISEPFIIDGREIFTSASIGIAMGSTEYENSDQILRDADITMYRAKTLGKARIEVFDEALRSEAVSLLNTETELRRAIESQDFVIHYQPIVSLETGDIDSIEALIRWNHPSKGIIPPADFIPLAEETGLIIQIGDFVLRTVCAQIKTWQDEGLPNVRVAVNISAVQFRQERFADTVKGIIEEAQISPSTLDIEITESLFLDQSQKTLDTIVKLKEYGLRICLDDFGTGYSSLSYLQNLPIDVLKIDRSFIEKMEEDSDQARIISTIVSLGKNLGMQVIAEGIETCQQLSRLKLIRCSDGQGYLFSRPVDTTAATNLLTAGIIQAPLKTIDASIASEK
jgi:diguanylate cyclase (GGDEF)-like protein/PAS domain S-box-containing protein